MLNFYQQLPAQYRDKNKKYKNYNQVKIDVPMRMVIVGASGSGKTNSLMNIIHSMNAWDKIWLFAKNLQQPLYKYLMDALGGPKKEGGILFASDTIDELPDLDTFDSKMQNLVVFDDMMLENKNNLKKIESLFIRGRHKSISPIFISQSYFDTPKLIRKNADLIVIKKISTKRDLSMIAREYSLDKSADELMAIYNKIKAMGFENWFLIDTVTNDPTLKYRINFSPIQ